MPKQPNEYPRFSFRLNEELLKWLEEYAKKQDKSKGTVIKELLEDARRRNVENLEGELK